MKKIIGYTIGIIAALIVLAWVAFPIAYGREPTITFIG